MNITISDKWNEYLEEFPVSGRDIYFYEEYVKLYENEECMALCAVCEEDRKLLLMPFLQRKIGAWYDFETAYGYGGPISNISDRLWWAKAFGGMKQHFAEHSYVCGFTRFHHLLGNAVLYEYTGNEENVIYDRQTVVVDTSQTEQNIWMSQISSKNRNMVRKAEKNELIYKSEFDFESLEEFKVLYRETMKRLQADSFYFFDSTYFEKFIYNLKDKAFLGTVRKDGKLVCGALFMYSDYFGHYHLEGSDHDYCGLGANNYLLWKAACEMHRMGIREFHLGGGTEASPQNSLFKFKKAFSSNVREFFIGKDVFNKSVYYELCSEWERKNIDKSIKYGNRLMKYRY